MEGIYLESDDDAQMGRPAGSFPHYLGSNFNLNIVYKAWNELHPESTLWKGGITHKKFREILKESNEYYEFEAEYLKNNSRKVMPKVSDRKEYQTKWIKKKRKNGTLLSPRFSL